MNFLKVEGHNNYVRDPKSNSIVNVNMTEYNEYLIRKELKQKESQKLQSIEDDISNIKGDLEEIKMLLRRFSNEH